MSLRAILGWGVVAVAALLVGALVVTAIRNRSLPTSPAMPGTLGERAQVHLAEAAHLIDGLGDKVWPASADRPGWHEVPIPLVTYDEAFVYLVGHPNPPAGWRRVPDGQQFGNPWEPIDGMAPVVASVQGGGQVYRAPLPGGDVTPQAFTVQIGELWASSMATQEWTRIMLYEQFHKDLPPVLRDIFPYRLAASLLLQGSDGYLMAIVHEAFHAYQGSVAPERLIAGERVQRAQEGCYPWEDQAFEAAWQVELDLLVQGLRAESDDEARERARTFLAQREARRQDAQLDPALIDYERQREWVEGLAKYSELRMWEEAYEGVRADPPSYVPVGAMDADADFRSYNGYPNRYRSEVAQVKRTAGRHGDGRFYYSGMAQAYLLDRLAPGWKAAIFEEGVFLEALLSEAVDGAAVVYGTADVTSPVDAGMPVP